jgi:hypothetical protein
MYNIKINMNKKNKNKFLQITLGLLLALGIVSAMGYWYKYTSTPGNLDQFATCLSEKGATFYGAFWCPHCQDQKALFGKSKVLIPYVECSMPDQRTQTQICIDKGIKSYPTWIYADGASTTGERTLVQLAEKTGCILPVESK